MSKSGINVSTTGEVPQPEYRNETDAEFTATLSAEMARRTDKLQDNTIDLAIRMKQARDFLEWSTHHMRGTWLDWMKEADQAAKDINIFRMTFDRESKTVIAAGKDVKDFFNSPDYLKAQETLKEMVTLLERFATLKTNGTLDAFADFILKVQCK